MSKKAHLQKNKHESVLSLSLSLSLSLQLEMNCNFFDIKKSMLSKVI